MMATEVLICCIYFQTTPASFRPVPEPPVITSQGSRETGNSSMESLMTADLHCVTAKTLDTINSLQNKSVMEVCIHAPSAAKETP